MDEKALNGVKESGGLQEKQYLCSIIQQSYAYKRQHRHHSDL